MRNTQQRPVASGKIPGRKDIRNGIDHMSTDSQEGVPYHAEGREQYLK